MSEKLEYVVLALHGEALTRFEWWEAQSSFHTWLCLKQDLLRRFKLGAASNPLAPLLKVRQVGSIMDYRREFELAARSHRNLGGETLICMFHEGLKPTISSEMAVTEFENLQAMMDRAMVLEARNLAWREERGQPWGRKSDSNFSGRNNTWARPNNADPNSGPLKPNSLPPSKGDTKPLLGPWRKSLLSP